MTITRPLRQQIGDYLTKQFVYDEPADLPLDECVDEADHVIRMVAEHTVMVLERMAGRLTSATSEQRAGIRRAAARVRLEFDLEPTRGSSESSDD